MTNITFSIDDDIHKKMKEHSEIKWTEILRQSIINYLKKLEKIDVISIKDFRENLDPELLQKIEVLNEQEEVLFYEKTRKMERERGNHLQNLERSSDK